MARFLIHIGPHKTATTYLQQCFQTLHKPLADKGILFPLEWCASAENPSHERLYQMLKAEQAEPLGEAFGRLQQAKAHTVLISSEGLVNLPQKSIDLLGAQIAGSPVRVIFYCRRWSELLPSAWQTLVREGSTLTFPAYAASVLSKPYQTPLLNYALPLDRYASVFGADAIRLVSFNNLVESKKDIAEHFLERFLSWTDMAPLHAAAANRPKRPNSSLSNVDAETLRALNVLSAGLPPMQAVGIRRRFLTERTRIDLAELRAAMQDSVQVLKLSEHERMFQELHASIDAKYGQHMVPPRKVGRLFWPRWNSIEYVGGDYLLKAGARDALVALHRRLAAEASRVEIAEEQISNLGSAPEPEDAAAE